MPPLYDAHNHYQDAWLKPQRERILADLASVGVRAAVVNGSCESDWLDVASLVAGAAASGVTLLPSYGLHPWDVGNRGADWQKNLVARLDAEPHAAIGEIGLDRWMLDRARPDDPRLAGLRRAPLDEQIEAFTWQLELAAARRRPASIHCLDAFGALYDLLSWAKLPPQGFLLHAYSGPVEMVKSFAHLGAYFSFNGGFLDPRKARLREVYAAVPEDRLLVETDAPAMRLPAPLERFSLPPADDGSFPNHPANLAAAYTGLAEIRGVTLDALAGQVEKNFRAWFGLG
jgi:TatD DNase family protein